MAYENPKMTPEFKDWFVNEVESICYKKEDANVGFVYGRFDFEAVIVVSDMDATSVRDSIPDLKNKVIDSKVSIAPVIYLEGELPDEIASYLDSRNRVI